MDSPIISHMKNNIIPGILDILLGHCLQFHQLFFVTKLFDLSLGLHWVDCLWIISIPSWATTASTADAE